MKSCGEEQKYAYLERLSTDELEDILRADADQSSGSDVELILHITEILLEREERATGEPIEDVDRAWRDFQQYFNTPDATGRSLYPVEEDIYEADGAVHPGQI